MRKHSAVRAPVALFVVATVFAGCDATEIGEDGIASNTDVEVAASFSHAIPVQGQTRLRLDAVSGLVTIDADPDATNVSVTGERRVGSSSRNDAEAYLEKLEVRVTDSSDEVHVQTIQPQETRGRSFDVDYTVTIPSSYQVVVNHISGIVTLTDVEESTTVNLVSGIVDAEVAIPNGGVIDISVVSGTIGLSLPDSTSAELSASVVSGSITTSGLEMTDLVSSLTSVSGTIGDGNGRIDLSVVSGAIDVGGY